jgi:hypothetical protein
MYQYHDCAERGCDPMLKYAHERTWLLHRSRVETKMRGAGRPRLKVHSALRRSTRAWQQEAWDLYVKGLASRPTITTHEAIRRFQARNGL